MANKPTKRCSTPLIIQDKQIKTAMKYHYNPIRMAKSKQASSQSINQKKKTNPDNRKH